MLKVFYLSHVIIIQDYKLNQTTKIIVCYIKMIIKDGFRNVTICLLFLD